MARAIAVPAYAALFVAVVLSAGCACANGQATVRNGAAGEDLVAGASGAVHAPLGHGAAPPEKGGVADGAPVHGGTDVSPSYERCLKEGEPCNPLNDRCCEGYYCFGGVVPTCFRKL